MARYEHLPIYRAAFDLTLDLERTVRGFSRYNKYTLGSDLRQKARGLVEKVIAANESADRASVLVELRRDLEGLKVLVRLCEEAGAFAKTAAYLRVAEKVVGISRQNEGWLRHAAGAGTKDRSGEAGHGQSRVG